MDKLAGRLVIAILFLALSTGPLSAQQITYAKKILKQQYDLIPRHSTDTQFYEMESKLQKHALDGKLQGFDIYRLYLRCVPSKDPNGKDAYTCLRFTLQRDNATPVSIPSLVNWTYLFSLHATKEENKRQVFGIDHVKFENLTDNKGEKLPVENTYHVYNAFIDFHAMSEFSEKTVKDSGIQDLHYIGDKIVHSASYSQPPVNLGTQVAEGSYFKNGKITLEFKGLGLISDKPCAVLEYDSGESSFYMVMNLAPNTEVKTRGSSHYWGDIYKDLSGGWIQKANLHELVVSETNIQGMNTKVNAVIERSIVINNVKRINY